MSIYRTLNNLALKFLDPATLFKLGFNLSPLYRRTTARIIKISKDLRYIQIRLPVSWKNRNYMNTIFGGSMFSATDPIYMIQIAMLLGDDYVVWDKSSEIFFKKPAKVDLYADFIINEKELEDIKKHIQTHQEMVIDKTVLLTDKEKSVVYCEVIKRIYIADKSYYKQKIKDRKKKHSNP